MKLYVQTEEKVSYEAQFVVEKPDQMTDEEFHNILTSAEWKARKASTHDLITILRKDYGLKIEEFQLKDLQKPTSRKLEIMGVGIEPQGESDALDSNGI